MSLPAIFDRLRLPVIGAPLFIVSNPDLVIAQCKAGIVGSFPALNARPQSQVDEWIHQVSEELAAHDRDHPDAPSAPFAVNQIVHRSNDRFEADMMSCARYKVPIVITSLGARTELNDAVHGWGGITLHDIIQPLCEEATRGPEGLIAVAAAREGMRAGSPPLRSTNPQMVRRPWHCRAIRRAAVRGEGGEGGDLHISGRRHRHAQDRASDGIRRNVEGGAADITITTCAQDSRQYLRGR